MAKNYGKLKELKDNYTNGIITEEEAISTFMDIYQASKFSGKERRCAKRFANLLDIDALKLLFEI